MSQRQGGSVLTPGTEFLFLIIIIIIISIIGILNISQPYRPYRPVTGITLLYLLLLLLLLSDRLCGLVVRVLGYRSRGPGQIPGATRFPEK
jgi:hypothetical protein